MFEGNFICSNFKSTIAFIYAPCKVNNQWSLRKEIARVLGNTNGDILLMGVFNQVLSETDQKSRLFSKFGMKNF